MGQVNIIVFGDPAYQGRGMNALIVMVAILRKLNDGFFLSGGCRARFLIATCAFALRGNVGFFLGFVRCGGLTLSTTFANCGLSTLWFLRTCAAIGLRNG